jgi:hypothetical protein
MAGMMPMAATVLTGLNLVLLAALGAVWIGNYRTFKAPLALGLVVFAAVLFVENAVAVYFFLFSPGMLYADASPVQTTVAVMRTLQFVALASLTWVTMQ